MVKKFIFVLIIFALYSSITGCDMLTASRDRLSQAATVFSDSMADSNTTPSQDVENPLKTPIISDTLVFQDWELTLDSVKIADRVSNGSLMAFRPDEGNKYIVVNMNVKNTSNKAATFMPAVLSLYGELIISIHYDENFEYRASVLIGHPDDLRDSSIVPLASKTGILAFPIPDDVIISNKSLTIRFSQGDDVKEYSLR